MLPVKVIRCNNLPAMDITGKSDVYVKYFATDHRGMKFRFGRTDTVTSLDPVFNTNEFVVPIFRATELYFEVWDDDPGLDDYIGTSHINLKGIVMGEEFTFPVVTKERCKSTPTITIVVGPIKEITKTGYIDDRTHVVYFTMRLAEQVKTDLDFGMLIVDVDKHKIYNSVDKKWKRPKFIKSSGKDDYLSISSTTRLFRINMNDAMKEEFVCIPWVAANGRFVEPAEVFIDIYGGPKEPKVGDDLRRVDTPELNEIFKVTTYRIEVPRPGQYTAGGAMVISEKQAFPTQFEPVQQGDKSVIDWVKSFRSNIIPPSDKWEVASKK